jgi:hypothetical protein
MRAGRKFGDGDRADRDLIGQRVRDSAMIPADTNRGNQHLTTKLSPAATASITFALSLRSSRCAIAARGTAGHRDTLG